MSDTDHASETVLLHRMVFFSDAVFAIILTLLALELRPPVGSPGDLWDALIEMAPHFGAFALSFAVLGVFWVAHLSTMRRLVHFDWLVCIINLVLLFVVALTPFISGLVGEYGSVGTAWQVYCSVLVTASIAQTALLVALLRDNGRLIGGVIPGDGRFRMIRALSPGIAFGTGLILSLAGQPLLAGFCWVLFLPILLLARLVQRRKPKAPIAA